MRIEAQDGFVLHTRPWRETSLLVEVLSVDHGRIGLIARGVSSPRRQPLRAALQPMQWIRFEAQLRGELAQLREAEALDAAPRLAGNAMLASFYVCELCMRLAPRQDPVPEMYEAFAEVRYRMGAGEGLAWTLRRFERDLLDALGFGMDLTSSDEQPIDPAARYLLDPTQGPVRVLSERDVRQRNQAATGRGLLALAEDVEPTADDLASLRLPLRSVLLHHLGGRGLRSWEMLQQLRSSK